VHLYYATGIMLPFVRRLGFGAAALAVVLTACSGPGRGVEPELPKAATTGDAFEGAQCTAVRPPTEPDLMGWDRDGTLRREAAVIDLPAALVLDRRGVVRWFSPPSAGAGDIVQAAKSAR
jgi:hypothetical protein